MCDLQQVVERFDAVLVEAVCMLQVQSAGFLDLEALGFDFVSLSPSL